MNCTKRRKLKNDILFIAILMAVVIVAGVGLYFGRGAGDTVVVTVDQVVYGTYPLSKDVTVDILTGEDNHNLLVIQDGEAYVESATCPDGICAAHNPISRDGESIICLPHRVVVAVEAEE